jgi:CheY-like chemotaxis protein
MRNDIEQIGKAGERAATLTKQLLAFSRQQVLQPKVLNLNEIVSDMGQMIRRLVGDNIEFKTIAQPNLGRVKADPGHIEQVIMNLAINARDAMPNGGSLTLETTNIDLDEDYAREHPGVVPGPHVLLAVSDTGIGMDQVTREHIFEPFFTTKEKDKGTGLGLSTVFGIVKQSDGSVWVSSEPGQGTTFRIYLPTTDAAPEPVEQRALRIATVGGSETILLVEDDRQLRVVLRDVLVRGGYCVLDASDAEVAMRLSDEHEDTIHLLLTDVVMPKMSGPELAQCLASTRPDMRVLYMSGCTDDRAARRGVLQSVAYMQKPITPASLARKVRKVLDAPGKRSNSPIGRAA